MARPLLRQNTAITRNDGIRSPFGVADTPKAAFGFITSDRKSEIMKRRFILYRRKLGGVFYIEDTESRKQESLGTKDRAEATALTGLFDWNVLSRLKPNEHYTQKDISPFFWPNGKLPVSNKWKQLAANKFQDFKLKVGGLVEHPIELSLEELRALVDGAREIAEYLAHVHGIGIPH
jgi:hypothetical protein